MNAQAEPIPPERPGIAETAPILTGGVLLTLVAAMCLAAWYLPSGTNYLVVLGLMTAFFLYIGKAITGRALGILINERKLMSLSRLQLVIWTGLIVSGFFVIAIERIQSAEVAQPLSIAIDWQIWTLLGISAASLVGAPLLIDNKKAKDPKDKELVEKVATRFREEAPDVEHNRQGLLYVNSSIAFARFSDLFEGDELGNAHLVDVGKLQMFFFTIVVAVAYGTQLFQLIAYGELTAANVKLPELQDGVLALMGISNAGYLGSKGINYTPTPE